MRFIFLILTLTACSSVEKENHTESCSEVSTRIDNFDLISDQLLEGCLRKKFLECRENDENCLVKIQFQCVISVLEYKLESIKTYEREKCYLKNQTEA